MDGNMEETLALDDDVGLTLTPTLTAETMQSASQDPGDYWGTLTSIQVHLPSFHLYQPTFIFGRAIGCNIRITGMNFPIKNISLISKQHFEIRRMGDKPPMLTDLSKNGTYVNRVLVGRNNTVSLFNNDEISVGSPSIRVYSYQFDDFLPVELRKKYHLGKLLGQGGYGVVRLVMGKKSEAKFAVKKVGMVNESGSQIDSEIKILKTLSHPNIVALEEIVESDSSVFFVLEYMEGGDLGDFVQRNHPDEGQCKCIFEQIAFAVEYLHENGVAHRDLKPGNVLVKKQNGKTIVKITDFGLSKMVCNETMMKTLCGTPNFLAPEMINSPEHYYTKKVDVWSLGVLLYFMLSQKLPFIAGRLTDILKLITHSNLTFPNRRWKKFSDMVKNLLVQMLNKNPTYRIDINDVVKHPWLKPVKNKPKRMKHCMKTDSNLFVKRLRFD